LLAHSLGWTADDRILDLGAGPAHVSLVLAPHVGEVVVMDPEPAMIEEGKRRAAAAGATNLTFVVGGSDDLGPQLGRFASVTIAQALHWMGDQDAVFRALEPLAENVALVSYVKGPDVNRSWLDRPPWNVVQEILERHADEAPPRPVHDPFPEILVRSPFPHTELVTYERTVVARPSVEAAIGFLYSLSNVLPRLGTRRAAFEAEVREALANADTSPVVVRPIDSALIARR
jgi:SAM-dependent methyltransferase